MLVFMGAVLLAMGAKNGFKDKVMPKNAAGSAEVYFAYKKKKKNSTAVAVYLTEANMKPCMRMGLPCKWRLGSQDRHVCRRSGEVAQRLWTAWQVFMQMTQTDDGWMEYYERQTCKQKAPHAYQFCPSQQVNKSCVKWRAVLSQSHNLDCHMNPTLESLSSIIAFVTLHQSTPRKSGAFSVHLTLRIFWTWKSKT